MKTRILFMLLLFCSGLWGQVPELEELPRSIKREYRQDLRAAKKERKEAEREGWDILPDPIETPIEIPASYFDPGSLEIISWQTDLQRISDLVTRIQTECTYPIHYKISDSGADQTHPDLAAGFTGEFDWTGEGHNPGTHGTHVAGDVLQFMYPLVNIGLVTWDDQKSLRASGSGSFSWPANMFLNQLPDVAQRTANGQTVIYNCSWGGGTAPVESVVAQLRKTVEAGGIIVAAAGNTGAALGFPGNSPYTLGISSVDPNMNLSSFSSRGPEVWGTAGGRNIYSTLPNGNYGLASGTSMSSPSFAAIFVGYARAKWGPEALPDYAALYAYYKKIAVTIGDGNQQHYGFGYPYIETILNTPPDGATPPDGPGDPPPPPPSGELFYAAGIEDDGHIMRWRYEDETQWRLLYVNHIEWETLGKTGEAAAYKNADDFIAYYFQNRGIVLPPEMAGYSANWWTGTFLEYAAHNEEEMDLDVVCMVGKDELGTYVGRTFDRAGAAFLALLQGAQLVPID